MTGYPEVIPGQKSGSRTCQRLDVSETRFLGQPLYYRPGKYRYGSSRFVGRTAREARATKVPIEPTLLRMECHYCAIISESTRRRLCQNFAEAAGDNHILARLQHPNTHHNLVSVFGDTSASLRGAGCVI